MKEIETRAHSAITDLDMRKINVLTLKTLTPKHVAVFDLDLANDQIDRHLSRFPIEELRKIDRMIIGKPLMINHDMPGPGNRGSLPRGTFFQSRIVEGLGRTVVRPSAFVLRGHGDDNFIAHIEGGVYRGTSVSFNLDFPQCSTCLEDIRRCRHMPGEEIDREVCHVILREITSVNEGSIVPLGSQSTEVQSARSNEKELAALRRRLAKVRV